MHKVGSSLIPFMSAKLRLSSTSTPFSVEDTTLVLSPTDTDPGEDKLVDDCRIISVMLRLILSTVSSNTRRRVSAVRLSWKARRVGEVMSGSKLSTCKASLVLMPRRALGMGERSRTAPGRMDR